MRFPKISDVARDLRAINQEADAHPDGVDVRLQVYPDGDWAVHWGASSVPGRNKRFNSEETARYLISEAKDQYYYDKTYGG